MNITSIGGKIAVPHLLPYTASKFALVGLSEGLHAELKKHNITVTTVVPGLMQTGSPRNVTVKGNHKAEYAWFKISDSSSILSLKTETAAANIIKALEYGRPEAIFALTAKLASFVQGVAPGWLSQIMAAIDNILPDAATPAAEQKGYESESFISRLPRPQQHPWQPFATTKLNYSPKHIYYNRPNNRHKFIFLAPKSPEGPKGIGNDGLHLLFDPPIHPLTLFPNLHPKHIYPSFTPCIPVTSWIH